MRPNHTIFTSSVNILKAMTDTVFQGPSVGLVRIFFIYDGRFFSTRETSLVLTGWTLSYGTLSVVLFQTKVISQSSSSGFRWHQVGSSSNSNGLSSTSTPVASQALYPTIFKSFFQYPVYLALHLQINCHIPHLKSRNILNLCFSIICLFFFICCLNSL